MSCTCADAGERRRSGVLRVRWRETGEDSRYVVVIRRRDVRGAALDPPSNGRVLTYGTPGDADVVDRRPHRSGGYVWDRQ